MKYNWLKNLWKLDFTRRVIVQLRFVYSIHSLHSCANFSFCLSQSVTETLSLPRVTNINSPYKFIMQLCGLLYCAVPYCTLLYYIVWPFDVLNCYILSWGVLRCIENHNTTLFKTVYSYYKLWNVPHFLIMQYATLLLHCNALLYTGLLLEIYLRFLWYISWVDPWQNVICSKQKEEKLKLQSQN